MAQRKKHSDKRLSSFFDSSFWYSAQVMGDTDPSKPSRLIWASTGCEMVEGVLKDFKQIIHGRKLLESYPGLEDALTELEYPILKLKDYLNSPSDSLLNEKGAYIFWYYIHHLLKELEETAREIDYELHSQDEEI